MNEITEAFKQVSEALSKLGILVEKTIYEKENKNNSLVITDLICTSEGLIAVKDIKAGQTIIPAIEKYKIPYDEPQYKNLKYLDNNDGTIINLQAGLMWLRDPTNALSNYHSEFNWKEANEICKHLTYGVYSDWRLPTIQEELTLVNYARGGEIGLAIDISFFKNMKPCYYWTSTPCASSEKDAWVVDLKTGYSFIDNKSFTHPIHPVRSIK